MLWLDQVVSQRKQRSTVVASLRNRQVGKGNWGDRSVFLVPFAGRIQLRRVAGRRLLNGRCRALLGRTETKSKEREVSRSSRAECTSRSPRRRWSSFLCGAIYDCECGTEGRSDGISSDRGGDPNPKRGMRIVCLVGLCPENMRRSASSTGCAHRV